MPKPGKSSASSGTRKKHARRAAQDESEDLENVSVPVAVPKAKKGKKGEKPAPRVKMFIAPVKPRAARPDPLDSIGLAVQLPPDLVVVLRLLGKKDPVTKVKALDDLQTSWIDGNGHNVEQPNDQGLPYLETMLPVWWHHYPALILHWSRRVRASAAHVHSSLWAIPSVRDAMLFFLHEVADREQDDDIIGAWGMSAFDIDRQVADKSLASWFAFTSGIYSSPSSSEVVPSTNMALALRSVLTLAQRAVLSTDLLHGSIYPQIVIVPQQFIRGQRGGRGVINTPPTVHSRDTEDLPETDEETESDRNSRYRAGAVSLLEWVTDILDLELANPTESQEDAPFDRLTEIFRDQWFWTCIHPTRSAPWIAAGHASDERYDRAFGWGQPILRQRTWSLLGRIVSHWLSSSYIDILLPLLSRVALRSAWVDFDSTVQASMWQPLLGFLTKCPQTWSLEMTSLAALESDRSDEDDSGTREQPKAGTTSTAYEEFVTFLTLGCNGSPIQGYPSTIVILSTIPPEILSMNLKSIQAFLQSFWSAVNGRALGALNRLAAAEAFTSSLLECLLFLVSRLRKRSAKREDLETLVREQFSAIWTALGEGKISPTKTYGSLLAQHLSKLESIDTELFSAAWDVISSATHSQVITDSLKTPRDPISVKELYILANILEQLHPGQKVFTDRLATFVKELIATMVSKLGEREINVANSTFPEELPTLVFFVDILTMLPELFITLFKDEPANSETLESVFQSQIPLLLQALPVQNVLEMIFAHIRCCFANEYPTTVWKTLLKANESSETPEAHDLVLRICLEKVKRGLVPAIPRIIVDELDGFVESTIDQVVRGGRSRDTELVGQLLPYDVFIQPKLVAICIERLLTFVVSSSRAILRADYEILPSLNAVVAMLVPFSATSPAQLFSGHDTDFIPSLIVMAYWAPLIEDEVDLLDATADQSRRICDTWSTWVSNDQKQTILDRVLRISHDAMQDVEVILDASTIYDALCSRQLQSLLNYALHDLVDLLPAEQKYEQLLSQAGVGYVDTPLALFDPSANTHTSERTVYDAAGLSIYGRIAIALLQSTVLDHQSILDHMWIVPQVILLECLASDLSLRPDQSNAMFHPRFDRHQIVQIMEYSNQSLTFAFSHLMGDITRTWHSNICDKIKEIPSNTEETGRPLSDLIVRLFTESIRTEHTTVKYTRILRRLLHLLLKHSEMTNDEMDKWLSVAETRRRSSPQSALAVILVLSQLDIASPRLDRHRNEIASDLTGILPKNANGPGLQLLRYIVAVAPPPNSEITLLPPHRCVFLLQSLQKWVASDENLDSEVDSLLASLFSILVPVIQSVPGSHWDLIFDVMESNLEFSTFRDYTTVVALHRTLDLVNVVESASLSNRTFREAWNTRRPTVISLLAGKIEETTVDVPMQGQRAQTFEVLLRTCLDLEVPMTKAEELKTLVRSLALSDPDTQLVAYLLVRRIMKSWTEDLILKAAQSAEVDKPPYELPTTLVEALQNVVLPENDLPGASLCFILHWMLVFDCFMDVSIVVKNALLDHLITLDLVRKQFMPQILQVMEVSGGHKPHLEMWAVDEFHVTMIDDSLPNRYQIFAAHAYYRALTCVPTAVKAWSHDCKDRSLLDALTTFTSQIFSTVIVGQEMSRIKFIEGVEDLDDERLSLKIAPALRRITAVFTVDEQPMEISLIFPPDFPLHNVAVKDGLKLGIPEVKWRTWLLNVQLVMQQTGSVVEALSIWKRNIALHFEGEKECAICYSIISVSDRSLPKRPCKTCNNNFHASCLFKWFETSQNSTCPLCRSNML